MSAAAVIRMPEENKGVILRGHPMVFLVTGEDTKHTSMFDWTIPAGFATGLHVHRVQEETFYVLEGECEWHVGEKTIRATPGTYLFIPPGVPHNITNVSQKPARVLMTVSPRARALFRRACETRRAWRTRSEGACRSARPLRHRPALDFDNTSVNFGRGPHGSLWPGA